MRYGYDNEGITYRHTYTKPLLTIDELGGKFHGEYILSNDLEYIPYVELWYTSEV